MRQKMLLALALAALCALLLCACGQCEHDWEAASCDEPKTCELCGETEGAPKGHEWYVATCEKAKTCGVCGEVDGQPLGHSWVEATCESPKSCSTCGLTEGQALGHVFADYVDCENPPACGNCGILSQEAKAHTWQEADCETAKTCTVCAKTEGAPKGHEWYVATCETAKTCGVCGKTDGQALGHDWKEATCASPEICLRCSATQGEALSHQWQPATTEAPKTCLLCGATEGEKLSVDPRFHTEDCRMLFGVWGHTYTESKTFQNGETLYVTCAEMMGFSEDGRCQVVEVFDLEQYKAYMQLSLEEYLYDYYAQLDYTKDELNQAMLAQYGKNVHDYVAETVNGYTQEDATKITEYVYYVKDGMVCLGSSWDSDSFSGLYCTVEGDVLTLKNVETTITLTRMEDAD